MSLSCDTSCFPPPIFYAKNTCNTSETLQVVETEKGSNFKPLDIIETQHSFCLHPFWRKTRVNARIKAKPIIDLQPLPNTQRVKCLSGCFKKFIYRSNRGEQMATGAERQEVDQKRKENKPHGLAQCSPNAARPSCLRVLTSHLCTGTSCL